MKTALDSRLAKERLIKYEVIGIRDGWKGLVELDPTDSKSRAAHIFPLDERIVRTWDRYGGTNLGTSRTNPFNPARDTSSRVIKNIEKLNLDSIVAIGGEDTLGVANKLYKMGINAVGIPKTIDKDLYGTDYCLGFESALSVIIEEIDRLRTTAGSHKRIFVVETMGRNSGWLALEGGESSGAYIILIPEYDFEIERINRLLVEGRKVESRYHIVVISEGAKPKNLPTITKDNEIDSFGHETLGGVGDFLAREIKKGVGMDSRCVVLSHLQRGGAPCAYDRRMGRYFGIAAVDLIVKGQFGKMVSYKNGHITAIDLKEAVGKINVVDVEKQYDRERYNGRRSLL